MPLTSGRICLVSCYLGPLPRYAGVCLRTAARNADVDFLIVGDALPLGESSGHVRFEAMSRDAIARRFADRLGFLPAVSGRKLCDLKPTYGEVFSGLLSGYDFWGFMDLDLVWGHIADFWGDAELDRHDILATREDHLTGHCTILRNTAEINGLFRKVPFHRELLSDETHYGFDETATSPDGGKKGGREPLDFGWAKAHGVRPRFFDAVLHDVAAGRVRLHMRHCINEDDPRDAPDMRLHWRDGRLTDERAGREVMYHHLLFAKHAPFFRMPDWETVPDEFRITRQGIWCESDRTGTGALAFHVERARRGWWRFVRGIAGNVKRGLNWR